MRFCVRCGAEYPEGEVRFCPECGTSASTRIGTTDGKGPRSEPPRGRSAASWMVWSLAVLLAAGNLFQGLYFGVFTDNDAATPSYTPLVGDATSSTLRPSDTAATSTTSSSATQTAAADQAAAQSLLNNGIVAIQSAYIDIHTYEDQAMLDYLATSEPAITFMGWEIVSGVLASASNNEIGYGSNGQGFTIETSTGFGGSRHIYRVYLWSQDDWEYEIDGVSLGGSW